ncbi:50S ribosomal protein L6 [bacterium]|jgi:large subunit ribosomal protein L6|nr:50S ribosomal protein L6 [bacterium]
MSRVGVQPVNIPSGVKVDLVGQSVKAKGAKGETGFEIHPLIEVKADGTKLVVTRRSDEKIARALHGLTRALLQNLMVGVSAGFERKLDVVGVGYQAEVKGKVIKLIVGFAKPVELKIPEGVVVVTPDATHITVTGIDKQKVGQFAAEVRAVRKPEPYKGTGIKYSDEKVRRKAGKAFGSAS